MDLRSTTRERGEKFPAPFACRSLDRRWGGMGHGALSGHLASAEAGVRPDFLAPACGSNLRCRAGAMEQRAPVGSQAPLAPRAVATTPKKEIAMTQSRSRPDAHRDGFSHFRTIFSL